MVNITFELYKLRASLTNKGLEQEAIESIILKAQREISAAIEEQGGAAMDLAVEAGVQKRSPEFINELMMDSVNLELTTMSSTLDFSDPPFPMLSRLLQNAKPMKDGSGVYKVIPVGSKSSKPIASNIDEVHKRINVERLENARTQYNKIAPRGSKTSFRTATSKQDPSTQWVVPAKDKDFTEEVASINSQMRESVDVIVKNIINSYEDGF